MMDNAFMSEGRSGIYAIRNTITGDYYVGSSVNIKSRWSVHRAYLRQGRHHSAILQFAWNKYGADAFAFEVTEDCPREDLRDREQEYLDYQKGRYNISISSETGMRGRQHSLETRAKMSASKTGVPNLAARGSKREFTPEWIENMRAAALARKVPPRTGWHHSEETKAKCGTANVGNSHASGKRTPEQVERIRQGQLNRSVERSKPVAVAASA